MQVKRLISKRIRRTAPGLDLMADLNAALTVNVREERPSAAADGPPAPKPDPHRDDRSADDRGKEQR